MSTEQEILESNLTDQQKVDALVANSETPLPPVPDGTVSDRDPGEVAAMMMKEFAPRYKKAIKELTTGDCRRLCLALATWPLEFEQVLDGNAALQNAFAMGDRLAQARMLLIGDTLVQREAQQKVKDILAEQNKEEEKNGS